jgi:hypothetical protein
MDSSGACFIQIIFFAAIVGIAIAASYYNNKAIQEAWGRFAMNSGLILSQGGMFSSPRVTGDYKGFEYLLHTFSRGSGKSKTTYTGITMNFPKYIDCHLNVYQESFMSKIGKALGGQDIQIGDREFDEAFMIKSQTPEKIDKILTPDLRRNMLHGKHLINISVTGQGINYEKIGIIKDVANLTYVSEIMWFMANNACTMAGITPEQRELSDNNYGTDRNYDRPSQFDSSCKPQSSSYNQQSPSFMSSFSKPDNNQAQSDFTGSEPASFSSPGTGERSCVSCGASVPVANKYCINCGRLM